IEVDQWADDKVVIVKLKPSPYRRSKKPKVQLQRCDCGCMNSATAVTCEGCKAPLGQPKATMKEPAGTASPGRIREFADWYRDETHRRYNENRLSADELDAELNAKLRAELPPEQVEATFEQVMELVFAV